MISFTPYQPRLIQSLGILLCKNWRIKVYSITVNNEPITKTQLQHVIGQLDTWLEYSSEQGYRHYDIATLIIHQGRDGYYILLSCWVEENMLQNFVYLKEEQHNDFKLISDKGIAVCIWEMRIWWHERNAWIRHVLEKPHHPDFESYLNDNIIETYETI